MNAYASSVDDAVGTMNVPGDGIVIAVGGKKGLPNPAPFNPKTIVYLNLGAGGAGFTSFGACLPSPFTPDQDIVSGVAPQIFTETYPCMVSLADDKGNSYRVTLKNPPCGLAKCTNAPWGPPSGSPLMFKIPSADCMGPGIWCSAGLGAHTEIHIDQDSGNVINAVILNAAPGH